MATLDQLIGYSDAVRAVLQEIQILDAAVKELGSDPMGVLSAINLDSILATPVAKKLPVYPELAGVEALAKQKREKVPPLKLPDVDLPEPREKSVVDELRPTLEELNKQWVEKQEAKGGRIASEDPGQSYELREPEIKKRNLAKTAPGEPPITKPTQAALKFLYEYLQEHGPTPRVLVIEAAKTRGISSYALTEARRYVSDIKVKIIGVRGMHYLYLEGQESQLPNANGEFNAVKEAVASGRGLNPDEVSVLKQTPATVAEIIGRTGLPPQKVKNALEFLQRSKRIMLDKGANVWRPLEAVQV